ncbi:MAG: capsular biosynthesis protein, partial [Acidobacteriaceae bacterium]
MNSSLLLNLALLSALPLLAQTVSTNPPCPQPKQVEQMQAKLNDWPQLDRYRTADAALAAPASGVNRVVFYGDSITDNWDRVVDFFPGKPYVDRGISGQTTPQMLVRFQQDVVH